MVTCGVLLTDGEKFLICHPTGGKWWDLPKGKQDPDETYAQTAVRELQEETGISVQEDQLEFIGVFDYRPEKRLALFRMMFETLPDPASLRCVSKFKKKMIWIPEMDAFMVVGKETCLQKVSPNMRKVLSTLDIFG